MGIKRLSFQAAPPAHGYPERKAYKEEVSRFPLWAFFLKNGRKTGSIFPLVPAAEA
ncbi:hypothetical protein ACFSC6_05800 [Rufibacter sediminis]|uniref:Uncharacterized protein n=1 Tax=Rufibacter sediminis TaxID=2762756 RepID=A0ABR6VRS3_9BACT|nr:hypothetical protein [Rufibacter sediminis]MBC3539286.1 hypothetical protein [Rufibacter sediminis]